MQRLFSSFPHSWPGVGLVLLRLSLVVAIFTAKGQDMTDCCLSFTTVQQFIEFGLAISLLLGIVTPFAAAVLAALFFWEAYTGTGLESRHISLGTISLAVMMIGPGAWSLDALLFGRKRIEVRQR